MTATAAPQIRRRLSDRIPELDGVRGVALVMLIAFHYMYLPAFGKFPPGSALGQFFNALDLSWSCILLFFVLSGFLIGGILMDHRESENFFSAFYIRRICRIFPVYFGWLFLFCIALSMDFAREPANPMHRLFKDPLPLWGYFTYTQNFFMARDNVFGPAWMAMSWSLAIEEQFYMLLPFLIFFLPPRMLPYAIVLLTFVGPLFRGVFMYHDPPRWLPAYLLAPGRFDALFLGVLCAWLVRNDRAHKFLNDRRTLVYAFAGVMLLAIYAMRHYGGNAWSAGMTTFGYSLFALLYACVILIAVSEKPGLLGWILRLRILRNMGVLSYCVYILHQGVGGIVHALILNREPSLQNPTDLAVSILALALTFLLAAMSWRFFEKPIIHLGYRYRYRPGRVGAAQDAAT